MKVHSVVTACAALASAQRLALYRLLVRRGPEGFTPGELARRLHLPAPTLSFHLKVLADAGLVASRRVGRNLYYSPHLAQMEALVDFLTDKCCSLADDVSGAAQCKAAVPAKRRSA